MVTQRLLVALSRSRLGGAARRAANLVLGDSPRIVSVLTGPARGIKLELDLRREKAYWLGHYEPAVQRLLAESVAPGSVVYDVGAHIGFFSVCAARLGATVVAFEPAPENVRRIRRNAELNGLAVEVVEAAVVGEPGRVALVDGGGASEWRVAPGDEIPAVSLDSFAEGRARPTFLKIDAEGAEGAILRGAERVLRDDRPTIVCEVHGPEARAEVTALLEGYELRQAGSEWRIDARPARPVG